MKTLSKKSRSLVGFSQFFGLAIFLILGIKLSHAQSLSTTNISFQGALMGSDSQPLANGQYTLTFKFYNLAAGGTAIGTSSVPNVVVSGGICSTSIPVDPVWFTGQTLYLGVRIDSGVELSPRVLLSAVPYAVQASSLADGVDHISTTGNINIGNSVGGMHRALVFKGPNGPAGYGGTYQDILYEFNSAGSAIIRAYRGSSWDTYLEFLVSDPEGPNVVSRMTVSNNGLEVNGVTKTKVLQITGGADLAEHLTVTDTNPKDEFKVGPGMVVSVDPIGDRRFKLSDVPYDKRRVGIISGGNGIKPGLVLRDEGNPQADGDQPVALSGQVWCRADALFGGIQPGDLLTTSVVPGHAMKVTDYDKARFAVIGQALTGLKQGRGWVQVLVRDE